MKNSAQIAAVMAGAGLLIASLTYAYQQFSPYMSEENCLIQGAENSPESNALLARACRERFAAPMPEQRVLDEWEQVSMDGYARFSGNNLVAEIYNGHKAVTVTKLRVRITDPATADDEEPNSHEYEVSVNIPPLTTTSRTIPVFRTYDEMHWALLKAWGYTSQEP